MRQIYAKVAYVSQKRRGCRLQIELSGSLEVVEPTTLSLSMTVTIHRTCHIHAARALRTL